MKLPVQGPESPTRSPSGKRGLPGKGGDDKPSKKMKTESSGKGMGTPASKVKGKVQVSSVSDFYCLSWGVTMLILLLLPENVSLHIYILCSNWKLHQCRSIQIHRVLGHLSCPDCPAKMHPIDSGPWWSHTVLTSPPMTWKFWKIWWSSMKMTQSITRSPTKASTTHKSGHRKICWKNREKVCCVVGDKPSLSYILT